MPDPELTPDQEEQVRRLLAAARHDAPIPGEVADRLDRALADLSADLSHGTAGEAAGPPTVVDLAARRRRRNAAALLAGAAAVIVGGFAVGQVIDVGAGDQGADSALQGPVNRDDSGGSAADSGGGALTRSSTAPADGGTLPETTDAPGPMKLSSKHLRRDLAKQLPRAYADSSFDASAPQAVESFGCQSTDAAAYGSGRFFAAVYDGIPAVVALRPPAGDTQRADVLECTTAAELASATLTSR